MSISQRLRQAIDFIRAYQNPDGGWGYEPGRASVVEPSGFCALALDAHKNRSEADRGLAFLKSCQMGSGGVGTGPRDTEGGWMAYAALLAFHALDAGNEEGKLKAWILAFEDVSGTYKPADVKSIADAYGYDASIRGWPWTPRTTGWVEPTALFVLALTRAGVPRGEKRIASGIDLLLDRSLPSGGWNFGNIYAKSHELEPNVISTALALYALGSAGVPEDRAAVRAGIRVLAELVTEAGTAALAWALLAMRSYPAGAAHRDRIARLLAGVQTDEGGFHNSLFATALAFLALSEARILGPLSGAV